MGKMKEVYMQIMHANDGIPPGMTVGDMSRMQDWNIYEWQEYEREAEKRRLQHSQSENPGETFKKEQTERKFKGYIRED